MPLPGPATSPSRGSGGGAYGVRVASLILPAIAQATTANSANPAMSQKASTQEMALIARNSATDVVNIA